LFLRIRKNGKLTLGLKRRRKKRRRIPKIANAVVCEGHGGHRVVPLPRPLQGRGDGGRDSQGFTLGYVAKPRWGFQRTPLGFSEDPVGVFRGMVRVVKLELLT
jgi:hypothetical protein